MATSQIGPIFLRNGTSAESAKHNPVLAAREVAIDTTPNWAKIDAEITFPTDARLQSIWAL